MSLLEIQKNDLLSLTDEQLEELIARLAQSEVSSNGGRSSDVRWGGSLTAPDGGVDIRVEIHSKGFEGNFVPRKNTVFQAKRPKMQPAEILKEMQVGEEASPILRELSECEGAYIIVSLLDDNADPEYVRRMNAMQSSVEGLDECDDLHLDFYDRSRLHAWLREHPAVQIWVRGVLGKPLSGWKSLGRWSPTPIDVDDTMIFEEGVTVLVPGAGNEPLSLENAIPEVRSLVRESSKSVRIMGLSGVGKTRFVQALFEDDYGDGALNATQVIYADVGDEPKPLAGEMLEILTTLQQAAILVLDNCPADLHNRLASQISKSSTPVKLITVEYDISDDNNQITDVVRIDAQGTDIAEELVKRRYPNLGQINARTIAEFSQGNARLALALADAVPAGESLTQLSDVELFDRLFRQRNTESMELREASEALSLVYSFSVEMDETGTDELSLLGGLCDQSRQRMYRSAAVLLDRQIAQKRGRWRAVLPHAIANRLAGDALDNIPLESLQELFEQKGSPRLLKSFGRRLGFLHDHPVAQKIVTCWLGPKGLLSDFVNLNEEAAEMFLRVAPVAPEAVLSLIEQQLDAHGVEKLFGKYNPRRSTVLNLLSGMAYEPEFFERAIKLLLNIAIEEASDKNHDNIRDRIFGLFSLYLSGTHATLEQREAIVRECIWSDDKKLQSLGVGMLGATLKAGNWHSVNTFEFGARPRDYGLHPNYEEAIEWFQCFVAVAMEVADLENPILSRKVRKLLASKFRGLWRYVDFRKNLFEISNTLNDQSPWVEGWKAIKSILYYDARANDKDTCPTIRAELEKLLEILRPKDLVSEIRSLVTETGHQEWRMDEDFDDEEPDKYTKSLRRLGEKANKLGQKCAASPDILQEFSAELFEGHGQNRRPFGYGLLAGSSNQEEVWDQLVIALKEQGNKNFNDNVLCGALDAIHETDEVLANKILDDCLKDELLRPCLVSLHPTSKFSDHDFDRCMAALGYDDMPIYQYGDLLWRDDYSDLSHEQHIILLKKLLEKAGGASEVLDALSMRLHGKDKTEDILGQEIRELGLQAATVQIRDKDGDVGGGNDYRLTEFLKAALPFGDSSESNLGLLDALVDRIEQSYGYINGYDEAVQQIVKHMPTDFLDRAFFNDEKEKKKHYFLYKPSFRERHPLDEIPPEVLVEWCQKSNSAESWHKVASSIFPFKSQSGDGEVKLSAQALAIVEYAPDPIPVVEAFLSRISPNSWSGSRAGIMMKRRLALEGLLGHENPAIVDAITQGVKTAKVYEDKVRAAERKESEEGEQTFE